MNHERLPSSDPDAIADTAAHWCMRLQEIDCSDAERQAFAQWLAADPRHLEEYQAMAAIWQTAAHLPGAATSAAAPPPTPARAATRRQFVPRFACALLALPLAAWLGWDQGWLPNDYQHVSTGEQRQTVQLGDGSSVELNLHSELRYFNFKDVRKVTLVEGEAFFKVAHDATHPFIVHAGRGQTRVTGTQFNVWKYQDQVMVTLVEGSVTVNSDGEGGYHLGPGMQASYRSGDFEPRLAQNDDYANSLAWRDGKLVLDNLSLQQALPIINRYLDKPLQVADASTGSIRLSGVYNTHDVSRLVASLPKVLPVYLTRSKDGGTVLNRIAPPPPRG